MVQIPKWKIRLERFYSLCNWNLLLIYGFSIFNTAKGFIITVAGVLLLILFGKIELNSKYPAYDIKLYKNKKFLGNNYKKWKINKVLYKFVE